MKRQLRCRSHMESLWYESLKKDDVVICSFCCADEDALSTKDVKKQQTNLGGKTPLPMCVQCVEHKMHAPTFEGTPTNVLEKSRQDKAAKEAHNANVVARRLRRPTQSKK